MSTWATPLSPRSKREWKRDICKNLRTLRQPTWGFTIFRTIYTPESDIHFPFFLAKLGTYVKYFVDEDLRQQSFRTHGTEQPFDSGPNKEMKRRFVNDVVEDRKLSGVSEDEVRNVFTRWLEDNGVDIQCHQLYARRRVCIMVDEDVLNSVASGPEDPGQDFALEAVFVKVVEYLAPGECEWQAWLKVGLTALNFFWFNVSAGDECEDMFSIAEQEEIDVYTG